MAETESAELALLSYCSALQIMASSGAFPTIFPTEAARHLLMQPSECLLWVESGHCDS